MAMGMRAERWIVTGLMMAVWGAGLALPATGKPNKAQSAGQDADDVNGMVEQDTRLCAALAAGRLEVVQSLLQSPRIDVNKRGVVIDKLGNEWERTPLMLAARAGYTAIVDQMLDMGAEIDARDRHDHSALERGNTALMYASAANQLETVKALFNHRRKPDVNARNGEGVTPLRLAVGIENLELVQFLVGKGAKPNLPDSRGQSVLYETFLHNDFEVLDFLVAKGIDINGVDQGGATPLITAVQSNRRKKEAVLRWLEHFLTFKPKLDLQQIKGNAGGDSALQTAARTGFLEAIQLFLDKGASIDLASLGTGRTALAMAAMSHQVEAARLLLKRGAKSEIADKSAFTPLLMAVIQTDPDMVQTLLEGGAVPDVRAPGHNLTPLVAAAASQDPTKQGKYQKIMKLLLEHKAGIDFGASDGRTPLLACAVMGNQSLGLDTATLLLGKGANPDGANSKGETPLMLACGNGNEKLVKLLLKKDANVALRSGAGETAYAFAQRGGKPAILALLEAKGAMPEAPVALAKVTVKDLLGTWVGHQDGLPQAVMTLTLKKDNTFDFNSRLTPEVLKALPKGAMNAVIATQKGTYTINNDILVLNITGAAPMSRHWVLENKILVLDKIIKLKKK
jgi:ankyrin repeat protein